MTSRAFYIKAEIKGTLGVSTEESLGSAMSKALRHLFKGSSPSTDTSNFEAVGGKKYQLHDLPGAPICEFFEWKEGSLIVILRLIPAGFYPQGGLVKFYQMEMLAGEHLTLDPSNDFKESGVDWKLVYKDTGYRGLWDKFDFYKKEIVKQNGISSVDGFVGDWSVVEGHIQLLLTKLKY
jgi:hypothetical protein